MRVMTNTEAAVREMFQAKIDKGQMTARDAERLFKYGYAEACATISAWRRREATPETIEAHIGSRQRGARLKLVQARTPNQKNLAARELIVAQIMAAAWKGMQQDAAAYRDR